MSYDARDTVDQSHSSNSSCSTGELIDALNQAEAAQAEAFVRTSGEDAVAIREAMTATKTLRTQIQQLHGTEDFTVAFNRSLYAVPASVPRWLPNFLARQFSSPQSTRSAVIETARCDAAVATAGGGSIRNLPELRIQILYDIICVYIYTYMFVLP